VELYSYRGSREHVRALRRISRSCFERAQKGGRKINSEETPASAVPCEARARAKSATLTSEAHRKAAKTNEGAGEGGGCTSGKGQIAGRKSGREGIRGVWLFSTKRKDDRRPCDRRQKTNGGSLKRGKGLGGTGGG